MSYPSDFLCVKQTLSTRRKRCPSGVLFIPDLYAEYACLLYHTFALTCFWPATNQFTFSFIFALFRMARRAPESTPSGPLLTILLAENQKDGQKGPFSCAPSVWSPEGWPEGCLLTMMWSWRHQKGRGPEGSLLTVSFWGLPPKTEGNEQKGSFCSIFLLFFEQKDTRRDPSTTSFWNFSQLKFDLLIICILVIRVQARY